MLFRSGEERYSPPIIGAEINSIDGQTVLNFLDLIEVRFLDAFHKHGVSWKAIRIAAQRAKELLDRTHPFSTKKFKTDGKTILAEFVAETGDRVLWDMIKNQYEFKKVIAKYLYGGLDFNELEIPSRWYPLGKKNSVVVDPSRGFGAPIAKKSGIPTRILFQSYLSMKSFEEVARWFETDVTSVRDAVRFELNLPH